MGGQHVDGGFGGNMPPAPLDDAFLELSRARTPQGLVVIIEVTAGIRYEQDRSVPPASE